MENLGVSLQDYANFGSGFGNSSMAEVQELMKAMTAGQITGRDTNGSTTASGAPLKTESLETTLKILTNTERDIVFWKMIPKLAAYNTVEEYNQLVNYGLDGGAFTNEGELPENVDSVYRRQSQLVKFMGVTREVTHPMQLVSTMVGDMIKRETTNGMQWLLRQVERALPYGNSDIVPQEWNGLFKQHFDGFGASLDAYQDSEVIVDLRGKVLKDTYIESAAEGINRNFGFADKIIAPPVVFSNYVKTFHGEKLIQPNTQQVQAGVMGQKVVKVVTQFGDIDIVDDKFWKANAARLVGAAATSTKAPAVVVPAALTSPVDASNRWTNFTGDYYYAIAAKNRNGESTLTAADAAAVTVAVGDSVDIQFANGGGAYPATGFVIYRSKKGDSAKYALASCPMYPIFEVSLAQLAAGYDGGAAGVIRDRNRYISGCEQAMMFELSEQIFSFKQLAPPMKMDLAVLSPSTRFMLLLYGTPILYAPKKIVRLINIGDDFTS